MFCKNCGKEIDDKAAICPFCGVPVTAPEKKGETCIMAIIGFILSFLISIAGLVCSIIGYKKCVHENLEGKGFALAGIIISAVSMCIVVIYIIVAIAAASCAAMMLA